MKKHTLLMIHLIMCIVTSNGQSSDTDRELSEYPLKRKDLEIIISSSIANFRNCIDFGPNTHVFFNEVYNDSTCLISILRNNDFGYYEYPLSDTIYLNGQLTFIYYKESNFEKEDELFGQKPYPTILLEMNFNQLIRIRDNRIYLGWLQNFPLATDKELDIKIDEQALP